MNLSDPSCSFVVKKMNCINLESNDPYFNLAIEELLLKNSTEDYLILYVNSPSVIIGKHQTCHQEINTRFITENQIPVIRRITGGGTVYHDYGNLNFSFIKQCESGRQVDFRKYTEPVIDFLGSIGVKAEFGGKNDLKADGMKISGNAEHVHGSRVLHHGTLLFNASLDDMRNCIRKDKSSYSSRAVASNPTSVINLKGIINSYNEISEFTTRMFNYFLTGNVLYEPSELLILEAESVALSKYHTWEWNWAYGPEYTFEKIFAINGKKHNCHFSVKDGVINKSIIEGSDRMKKVSEKLTGCRHMVDDIADVFRKENINLSEEEIFNFF